MSQIQIEQKLTDANVYLILAKCYLALDKLKKAQSCITKSKIIIECMELIT